MRIEPESPTTPDIAALLAEHLADMRETSPPESIHALDVDQLAAPGLVFVSARDDKKRLMGIGALARVDDELGELKSMRTAQEFRGKGVAAAVTSALVQMARFRGYKRLSLETGTHAYFRPAHRLYERLGFEQCEPFGDYVKDPHSRFYTIELRRAK